MASLSSLGMKLRLADIDENLKSQSTFIPWTTNSLSTSAASRKQGFINDVPCFAYNEVFESGEVFKAVSPGSGIYLSVYSSPNHQPAFTLSKCRQTKTIEIEVHSLSLLQTLAIAIPSPFDFPSITVNYSTLKSHLQHLESISPSHPTTIELRLLIRDLLLDRALYAGIGVEFYRSQGLLTLPQLHDMHQRSIEAGLDDLDSCFSLGLVPDIVDDAYIDALKSRFTEVALSGDLAGLHELCEPVVRSGEIEWQTSPDLLLQLLDQGRLDIYRYVLDLASRTRDRSENQSEHWLSDISHDPLHMAIRLGHLEQVESFMQKGATFMGVYQSDEAAGGIVLTPLSAAAFWGQPEITRLILRHNVLAEGAQEAAVIALFNNDTEIMQILLSSGVTDPPVTLLAEETANSLADLNIADPQPFDMIQIGLNRTESDASTQECVQPLDVNMKSVVSISKSLQRPAKSLPKESIQPKGSRRRRHLLGRDLVTCMHNLCSQLRDICNSSVHDELQDLGNEYLYANGVWARGLGVFRGLMQDNPPSALVEAVDSLLVANAICLSLFKNDSSILIQFYNDLDRWRSVLPSSSRLLFDELAFGMWAFTPSGDTTSDLDVVNLPHFQELVQNLLSLEKRKESVPSRSSASGSRLSAIQREFETHETPQAATQGQAIPGRSPTRLDSYASSSTQRDDFLWADFVHMDRFEDTRGQSNTPPSLPNSWEDALSSTMMLLASVAFSIVLSFMIGLHGSMSRVFQTVAGTLPGYNRSCTLLADYLAMHDVSIASKLDSLQSELSSLVSPLRGQGSDAALTPVSSFSSLSTLGLRRNVSSSSVSSMCSTTSRPPSRDHPARGTRLPCPTPQCTKTFSSVSNRNKHIREGCAFNREKRQKYQCRNEPCTKVLTTRWYRDTHERERCRFRQGE